ncbi:MAG: NosD domain-containing protein [Candidatus Thorarchaeota archaeon]
MHIFASLHGQNDGGNLSGNSSWNSFVGLRLELSDGWIIGHNSVWGTSRGPMEFHEAENCVIEDNWICNNNGEYGVRVSSTHHSFFINNTVCNNTGPGFNIRYSSYNTFTGNIIEGNTGMPYVSENSHDNIFNP